MERKMDKGIVQKFNLRTFGHGLLMGIADSVPGVSGGTIALIIGIYHKLIKSLTVFLNYFKKGFPSKSFNDFVSSIYFLLPLGLGIICSYYFVTKLLVGPDESPGLLRQDSSAPYVYAFFFGLVFISIKEPWNSISSPSFGNYLLLFLGSLLIYLYTTISTSYGSSNFLLVICGALALTAMLLPGISGALVLLALGQYTHIANSVHDFDLEPLIFFLFGGILGLVTFVPLMNFFLKEYSEYTLSVLAGLMLGSLITLWPWKYNYNGDGLSPNLSFGQIFDNYSALELTFTLFIFGFGMSSSYVLKHYLSDN
jgi:putative membrane protein|tara:strand:+ start:13901 stop:14833 length:933 start_codon:yes stop_codon:yes gene_type:complete